MTDENVVVHYLFIHKHAPLLWFGWMFATFALMVHTLINGSMVGYVGSEPVVPLLMMFVGFVWVVMGASAGWMPRP